MNESIHCWINPGEKDGVNELISIILISIRLHMLSKTQKKRLDLSAAGWSDGESLFFLLAGALGICCCCSCRIARGVGVVLQLLHGAPGRAAPFSAVGGILTLPRLHMRSHSA